MNSSGHGEPNSPTPSALLGPPVIRELRLRIRVLFVL